MAAYLLAYPSINIKSVSRINISFAFSYAGKVIANFELKYAFRGKENIAEEENQDILHSWLRSMSRDISQGVFG